MDTNDASINTNGFIFKKECYDLIGACMSVHSELGCGFLEAVYQEALCIEFIDKKIPFEREKTLHINYKGILLDKTYVADFLCYKEIIVELKACETLVPYHVAQVLNYLKATGMKLGLLINFGSSKLEYKRIII